METKDNKSFEILDKLSDWALSEIENDPARLSERIKSYKQLLAHILNTKIEKWDKPQTVQEKVRNTITELKLKHNYRWSAAEIKTLNELIKNKWGKFVSNKQKGFFKSQILKAWASFDSEKNAFLKPLVDYKTDSDIWVVYEAYRFWDSNRNYGYTYFFIDEQWVRLAVEHKLVYKRINVPRWHGFSKDRPWHTRARRNEMNHWEVKFDENLFSEEKVIFVRQK
ncbi:MAG: hypothetical protein ACD_2C00141G0016 [uncultured bacterium (gcode 4)]|uniref:Uncharacterized protein n=1 Tax=uncultured bacterium (gcode 4) TaxID=1234023 RepID=K2GGP7_9BACT|nr:MAG: hypothetical protein ACD_2C00141G0016 [uncultured bacterium (gcode 4)]